MDEWIRVLMERRIQIAIRCPLGPLRRAFILFSTFLDLRPVSAANDLQTSINGRLEIQLSKSKTPV
jgi:hypothetical protein